MLHLSMSRIAGALVVMSSLATSAMADTITVCLDGSCDFTDPAEAAMAAVSGDVVEISAGTYYLEESVSTTNQIAIRGAVDSYGEPATILDGQGELIVLGAVYADQAVFENLVITNGFGEYGGGARFIASSDVVVRNCHFRGNHANWNGGGLRLSLDTSLTLVDCEITDNTAEHPEWGGQSYGAGAHVSSATLIIERTRVCGNVSSNGTQITGVSEGDNFVNLGSCIEDDCQMCVTADPADLDFNGSVDVVDLLLLLDAWGGSSVGDIDGSGLVDVSDVLLLIGSWS
ncbi:MAG: right-handed parallel beta-helix repeat-containing protein [Phycisphaerales bacterium]|nr:right-handed parallel beta-helix repeat-containing protein [Phycisphaerales bacterium]